MLKASCSKLQPLGSCISLLKAFLARQFQEWGSVRLRNGSTQLAGLHPPHSGRARPLVLHCPASLGEKELSGSHSDGCHCSKSCPMAFFSKLCLPGLFLQLEKCAQDLGSTSKGVGSSMAQLLTCAAQGNEHYTGRTSGLSGACGRAAHPGLERNAHGCDKKRAFLTLAPQNILRHSPKCC